MSSAACVQCSHSAHEGYCGTTCCPCWTELHAALTRIVEADDSRRAANASGQHASPISHWIPTEEAVEAARELLSSATCLRERRGGLRAGAHADCPIHGQIPVEELERWERETGEHRDNYPLDPGEYWARAAPERVSFVADEYWLAWWMSGVHRDDPVYSDKHLGLALDLRDTLPAERIARAMESVGLQIRDREA